MSGNQNDADGANQKGAQPAGRMAALELHMDQVKRDYAEWFFDYDSTDPSIADRVDVERLLETAPTEITQGLIAGIMTMRQQIAIVTGREF